MIDAVAWDADARWHGIVEGRLWVAQGSLQVAKEMEVDYAERG